MATAEYGTVYAKGLNSGAVYVIDIYISDVNGALVTFDGGAGASSTSPNFYTFPEDVIVYDLSIASAPTATSSMRLTGDGRPSPSVIRYANHINSLNNRPPLGIKIRKGTRVTAVQYT